MEYYLVEKNPPIAWVFLNRPDKKNAMNAPAWTESEPIFEDLDQDDDIRAVIISGKGDGFSAGIDLMGMLSEFPELMADSKKGNLKPSLIKKIIRMQNALSCIEWCRKPVIAAIHGHCIGAGLDMAAACDIRLCAENTVFSLKEAALGFVADLGVLQRLPLIVGQGITRELAFTAKNFSAGRAKEILLVNKVYKDHETLMNGAEKLAVKICDNSPIAVQATKTVLNYSAGNAVNDGLEYVASVSANIIPSNDLMEAVTAFSENRKPKFTGK